MCALSKENFQAFFCLVFAMICLLTPVGVWGQAAATGTIHGVVTDPTNAVVPDATVTITDSSTNVVRTATTNESGRYIFPGVPPGIYELSIAKTGFRTAKFVTQQVTVGSSLTLDVKLELGPQTQ